MAGMDVVEVSPPYDHAEVTAYLANRVVLEALSGMAWRRRRLAGAAVRRPGRSAAEGPPARLPGSRWTRRRRVAQAMVARIPCHHLEGGVGVQEGEPGHRLALPGGGGDEAGLVGQQPGRPGLVVAAPPAVPAEQHHRQLGLAHQLEVGVALMSSARPAGGAQHGLDGVAVGVGAVDGQGEPQGQPPGPAGEVDGVVAGVRRAVLVALLALVGGGGRRGRRRPGCGRPGPGGARGRGGRRSRTGANSHLWGSTMNESACSMPAKRCRTDGREQRRPAVGGVDVEPQPALGGHGRHPGQVVDDPGVGGAGGGHHGRSPRRPSRVGRPAPPPAPRPVRRWSPVGTRSGSTPMTWRAPCRPTSGPRR